MELEERKSRSLIFLFRDNFTYIGLAEDERTRLLLVPGYDYDVVPLGPHKIKAYSAGPIVSRQSLGRMLQFAECADEQVPAQTGYGLGLRRLVIAGACLADR